MVSGLAAVLDVGMREELIPGVRGVDVTLEPLRKRVSASSLERIMFLNAGRCAGVEGTEDGGGIESGDEPWRGPLLISLLSGLGLVTDVPVGADNDWAVPVIRGSGDSFLRLALSHGMLLRSSPSLTRLIHW